MAISRDALEAERRRLSTAFGRTTSQTNTQTPQEEGGFVGNLLNKFIGKPLEKFSQKFIEPKLSPTIRGINQWLVGEDFGQINLFEGRTKVEVPKGREALDLSSLSNLNQSQARLKLIEEYQARFPLITKKTAEAAADQELSTSSPNKYREFLRGPDYTEEADKWAKVGTLSYGAKYTASKFTQGITNGLIDASQLEELPGRSGRIAEISAQALGTITGIMLTKGALKGLLKGRELAAAKELTIGGKIKALGTTTRLSQTKARSEIVRGIRASVAVKNNIQYKLFMANKVLDDHKYVKGFLESMGSFTAFGQINPDLAFDFNKRIDQAKYDSAMGIGFAAIGMLAPGLKLGIPAQFATGYGLSKMGGESDEDAIVNGVIFAGLHGAGLITQAHGRSARVSKAKELFKENGQNINKKFTKGEIADKYNDAKKKLLEKKDISEPERLKKIESLDKARDAFLEDIGANEFSEFRNPLDVGIGITTDILTLTGRVVTKPLRSRAALRELNTSLTTLEEAAGKKHPKEVSLESVDEIGRIAERKVRQKAQRDKLSEEETQKLTQEIVDARDTAKAMVQTGADVRSKKRFGAKIGRTITNAGSRYTFGGATMEQIFSPSKKGSPRLVKTIDGSIKLLVGNQAIGIPKSVFNRLNTPEAETRYKGERRLLEKRLSEQESSSSAKAWEIKEQMERIDLIADAMGWRGERTTDSPNKTRDNIPPEKRLDTDYGDRIVTKVTRKYLDSLDGTQPDGGVSGTLRAQVRRSVQDIAEQFGMKREVKEVARRIVEKSKEAQGKEVKIGYDDPQVMDLLDVSRAASKDAGIVSVEFIRDTAGLNEASRETDIGGIEAKKPTTQTEVEPGTKSKDTETPKAEEKQEGEAFVVDVGTKEESDARKSKAQEESKLLQNDERSALRDKPLSKQAKDKSGKSITTIGELADSLVENSNGEIGKPKIINDIASGKPKTQQGKDAIKVSKALDVSFAQLAAALGFKPGMKLGPIRRGLAKAEKTAKRIAKKTTEISKKTPKEPKKVAVVEKTKPIIKKEPRQERRKTQRKDVVEFEGEQGEVVGVSKEGVTVQNEVGAQRVVSPGKVKTLERVETPKPRFGDLPSITGRVPLPRDVVSGKNLPAEWQALEPYQRTAALSEQVSQQTGKRQFSPAISAELERARQINKELSIEFQEKISTLTNERKSRYFEALADATEAQAANPVKLLNSVLEGKENKKLTAKRESTAKRLTEDAVIETPSVTITNYTNGRARFVADGVPFTARRNSSTGAITEFMPNKSVRISEPGQKPKRGEITPEAFDIAASKVQEAIDINNENVARETVTTPEKDLQANITTEGSEVANTRQGRSLKEKKKRAKRKTNISEETTDEVRSKEDAVAFDVLLDVDKKNTELSAIESGFAIESQNITVVYRTENPNADAVMLVPDLKGKNINQILVPKNGQYVIGKNSYETSAGVLKVPEVNVRASATVPKAPLQDAMLSAARILKGAGLRFNNARIISDGSGLRVIANNGEQTYQNFVAGEFPKIDVLVSGGAAIEIARTLRKTPGNTAVINSGRAENSSISVGNFDMIFKNAIGARPEIPKEVKSSYKGVREAIIPRSVLLEIAKEAPKNKDIEISVDPQSGEITARTKNWSKTEKADVFERDVSIDKTGELGVIQTKASASGRAVTDTKALTIAAETINGERVSIVFPGEGKQPMIIRTSEGNKKITLENQAQKYNEAAAQGKEAEIAESTRKEVSEVGYSRVKGKKVESPADAADLSRLHFEKVPGMENTEHARVVVVDKNNKVVSFELVGVGNDRGISLNLMKDVFPAVDRSPGNKFFLVHNHPRITDIKHSTMDIVAHNDIAKLASRRGLEYGGSIVIDTTRYSFVDGKKTSATEIDVKRDFFKSTTRSERADFVKKQTLQQLRTDKDIARWTKASVDARNPSVGIVLMTSDGFVKSTNRFNIDTSKNYVRELQSVLRNIAREGSADKVIVSIHGAEAKGRARELQDVIVDLGVNFDLPVLDIVGTKLGRNGEIIQDFSMSEFGFMDKATSAGDAALLLNPAGERFTLAEQHVVDIVSRGDPVPPELIGAQIGLIKRGVIDQSRTIEVIKQELKILKDLDGKEGRDPTGVDMAKVTSKEFERDFIIELAKDEGESWYGEVKGLEQKELADVTIGDTAKRSNATENNFKNQLARVKQKAEFAAKASGKTEIDFLNEISDAIINKRIKDGETQTREVINFTFAEFREGKIDMRDLRIAEDWLRRQFKDIDPTLSSEMSFLERSSFKFKNRFEATKRHVQAFTDWLSAKGRLPELTKAFNKVAGDSAQLKEKYGNMLDATVKLNAEEWNQLRKFKESGQRPEDPKMAAAFDAMVKFFAQVRQDGLSRGLDIGDIADYWPRRMKREFYDNPFAEQTIIDNTAEFMAKRAREQGDKTATAKDFRNEATRKFNSKRDSLRDREAANLERTREQDLTIPEDIRMDAQGEIAFYTQEAARRYAEVDGFGKNDVKFFDMLGEAQKRETLTIEEAAFVERQFLKIVDPQLLGIKSSPKWVQRILAANTALLSPMTAALQISQVLPIAARWGMRRTIKTLWDFGVNNKEAVATAKKTGAIERLTMREVLEAQYGGGTVANRYFKWIGMEAMEKFLRVNAANASMDFVAENFKAVKDGRLKEGTAEFNRISDEFKRLDIDFKEILADKKFGNDLRGLESSPGQQLLNDVGFIGAKDTQFLALKQELPPIFWENKIIGPLLGQFRSYSWEFAFKKNAPMRVIAQEAMRSVPIKLSKGKDGTFKYEMKPFEPARLLPLLTLTMGGVLVGEVVEDLRALYQGRSRPLELLGTEGRLIENLMVQAFGGVAWDIYRGAKFNRLPQTLAGPFFGNMLDLTFSVQDVISDGEFKTLQKFAGRNARPSLAYAASLALSGKIPIEIAAWSLVALGYVTEFRGARALIRGQSKDPILFDLQDAKSNKVQKIRKLIRRNKGILNSEIIAEIAKSNKELNVLIKKSSDKLDEALNVKSFLITKGTISGFAKEVQQQEAGIDEDKMREEINRRIQAMQDDEGFLEDQILDFLK